MKPRYTIAHCGIIPPEPDLVRWQITDYRPPRKTWPYEQLRFTGRLSILAKALRAAGPDTLLADSVSIASERQRNLERLREDRRP